MLARSCRGHYQPGVVACEGTLRLVLRFKCHDGDSLLTRVYYHGNSCCTASLREKSHSKEITLYKRMCVCEEPMFYNVERLCSTFEFDLKVFGFVNIELQVIVVASAVSFFHHYGVNLSKNTFFSERAFWFLCVYIKWRLGHLYLFVTHEPFIVTHRCSGIWSTQASAIFPLEGYVPSLQLLGRASLP